ncbi:hypothetical protein [Rhizobium aethiopicum]|uniref:Ribosomal protein L44E n=1 Tax=Rhizobium aethiopicum TaxID=1138170 RepID=A0A7W6QC69_9HYPH|nr:hypothetical protein [Rhizobium aethiopicum]MBB4194866.1 ribosomal protein L44E [Rhizobium aethiopicum]
MVGARRFQEFKDWSPGYINVTPEHVAIMAECTACGAAREFARESLPSHLQFSLISEIEQRLKCTECGAKAGKLKFGFHVGEHHEH